MLDVGLPPFAIAWPRENVVIAGGSAGLLATAKGDPVSVNFGLEDQRLPSIAVSNFRELEFQHTILAIACTPSDPLDCVAAGLEGLIVRGDGTNWRIQALPATAPTPTHITGVAFDGRTPLLATTDGLYVADASGEGYVRDDDLRARMAAAGLPAAVRTVATVADGGSRGRRSVRARQRHGAVAPDRGAAGSPPVRARRVPRPGRCRPFDRVRDD